MAKIKIKNLPRDMKISEEDLKKIKGGLLFQQQRMGGFGSLDLQRQVLRRGPFGVAIV